MNILVTYPLSPELVRSGLGNLVVYRPEIAAQGEEALRRALAEHAPEVVLVGDRVPEVSGPVRLIRRQGDDLHALGLAERHVARRLAAHRLAACGISSAGSGTLAGSRVTLVGAGIVNLVTALALADQGAGVEVLEAGPDPRGGPDWQRLGATHGGENARMFCFTEADNYNAKSPALGHSVTGGGWLVTAADELDPHERAWIESFSRLPRWRARGFAEEVHGFNAASHPLWEKLRRDAAHLFDGVGYTPGVLRIYSHADAAEAARVLHAKLGSLLEALDPAELVRRHPACAEAVDGGHVAGALEVRGFTLNVHDFCARLLAHLERKGVRFHWNRPVSALERAGDGSVTGLRLADSDRVVRCEHVVRSEHYVLSPGAHGYPLLETTRTAGKIQGVLGLWLILPNPEPRWRRSVKIHREGHVGEHSNVILASDASGRPVLILGSGYGFLGSRKLDMGSPEIARLFEALAETARRYFPRACREATASRRACVRPFTGTGLGIFEVLPTAEGGRLIVASGHNTGGFAQSPAVAEAVVATLQGRPHEMQALYDPERGVEAPTPLAPT